MRRTAAATVWVLLLPLLAGCIAQGPGPATTSTSELESTFRIDWSPADPRMGEAVRLEVAPDAPDDAVVAAAWRFGDGTSSRALSAEHVYREAGRYRLEVSIETLSGDHTTLHTDLLVLRADGSMPAGDRPDDASAQTSPPTVGSPGADAGDSEPAGAPVASINTSRQVIPLGHPVTLDGSGSHDPAGEGLDYMWDLGDGTTAQGSSVEHTYKAEGPFDVHLTITDADGAQDNATVQVEVDGDYYEQHVWFNWGSKQLDILILGVEDPVVGATIQEAIDAWEIGIAELDPEFAADLEFRVYWPVVDAVPPAGFDADIVFVPQGFMAVSPILGTCTATAPLSHEAVTSGPNAQYRVAAHEFGHCLGLSHVFQDDVEYDPPFDLMGGGRSERSCPSNLNMEILYMVFSDREGTVQMPASLYHQADSC